MTLVPPSFISSSSLIDETDNGANGMDMALVAWTIVAYGIRIVLCIALLSLSSQIRGLGGRHGLYPIGEWLHAIRQRTIIPRARHHYNGGSGTGNGVGNGVTPIKRFLWFPTIYWYTYPDHQCLWCWYWLCIHVYLYVYVCMYRANHSDAFLYASCIIASIISLLSCLGGAASRPLLCNFLARFFLLTQTPNIDLSGLCLVISIIMDHILIGCYIIIRIYLLSGHNHLLHTLDTSVEPIITHHCIITIIRLACIVLCYSGIVCYWK
jgi:hypothetical protein